MTIHDVKWIPVSNRLAAVGSDPSNRGVIKVGKKKYFVKIGMSVCH